MLETPKFTEVPPIHKSEKASQPSSEASRAASERDAREALRKAPGVSLLDRRDDGGYASPAEIVGEDMVYVSRIRRDATLLHGLSLWAVGDDVRLGAALNAALLAEAVLKG